MKYTCLELSNACSLVLFGQKLAQNQQFEFLSKINFSSQKCENSWNLLFFQFFEKNMWICPFLLIFLELPWNFKVSVLNGYCSKRNGWKCIRKLKKHTFDFLQFLKKLSFLPHLRVIYSTIEAKIKRKISGLVSPSNLRQ